MEDGSYQENVRIKATNISLVHPRGHRKVQNKILLRHMISNRELVYCCLVSLDQSSICPKTTRPSEKFVVDEAEPREKWEAGNWSPCILDKEYIMDSEGLCRGYRLKFVICRVNGSIYYTDSECSTPSPARAIYCKTPCPQNCIVGPWSRWSSCSCQDSSSQRTRTVLVAPSQVAQRHSERAGKRTRAGLPEAWVLPKRGLLGLLFKKDWGRSYNSILGPSPKEFEDSSNFIQGHFSEDLAKEEISITEEKLLTSEEEIVAPDEGNGAEVDNANLPVIGHQDRKMAYIYNNGTRLSLRLGGGVRERRRRGLALQQGKGVPCLHLLVKYTPPDPSLQPCDTKLGGGVRGEEEEGPGPAAGQGSPLSASAGEIHPAGSESPALRYQISMGKLSLGPMHGLCWDGRSHPLIVGAAFRHVSLPMSGAVDQIPLHDDLCIHVEPPPRVQRCEVGCERDCAVGSWSKWGLCTIEDCSATVVPATPERSALEKCEQELGPAAVRQECSVPCDFECVVGTWSLWSPCSRSCASQYQVGFTHRNTSIIAPPGTGKIILPRPDELTQVETCREEPCGGASWSVGPWYSCILPAVSECGPGRQKRQLFCRNQANETLDVSKCHGLKKPSLERECQISCGTDCTITSWSEWSPCLTPDPCPIDGRLISSVQHRCRRILVSPSDGSKQSPALEEERECAHAPVTCTRHHWKTGKWSSCILAMGLSCGTGHWVRSVECVDAIVRSVKSSFCLMSDTLVPSSSEECQVWCQNNCVTSSWSPWVPCPAQCSHTSYKSHELLDKLFSSFPG
ncbi:thrombospondin type-1 domain-containing protein 7B-like [Palaemon carinicauda]|uniref:thrombospondin type-1 domain-containing protein 7B-like n=1 Tax=Palaemon carinicauda TaxID=392227 RepID=UPI0035B57C54